MFMRILPSKLQGTLKIPPSKSHSIRAVIFALMASGTSYIENALISPDVEAAIRAVELFGAVVKKNKGVLEITGVGGNLRAAGDVINAGNSGLILRFIAAIGALQRSYTIITGDDSIRHRRPMAPLLSGLQQLGAFAVSSTLDGYAPIVVRGPMEGNKARITGEDSQPVSALLIASSFRNGSTTLIVDNPGETPWIDMTLYWLRRFGADITHKDYSHYKISGGLSYSGFSTVIPGDLSSLSYPVAAALITGSVLTISSVDMSDIQGDKRFIDILISMGASIEIEGTTLILKKGSFQGGVIDVNGCIDMVTIIAVVACFAKQETVITGAGIARHKESDRLFAITQELRKMGAHIVETQDGLVIQPSILKGAVLDAHSDHRIALALSVAALGAQGESIIHGTSCIAKTYPYFQEAFSSIGGQIL